MHAFNNNNNNNNNNCYCGYCLCLCGDVYSWWLAVGSPDDGHKNARNMLRYNRLPIIHYFETFSLPTDAHNAKKHRVIKTF